MEKKVIQPGKNLFRNFIFNKLIALGLISFGMDDLDAKELVLIIRPAEKEFCSVAEKISSALKDEFAFDKLETDEDVNLKDLSLKISEITPNILVLMDNKAVDLLKQYQAAKSDSSPIIPSVACMSVFLEKEIRGLKNATGFVYEVPIVTSLVNLRFILKKPIKRVGIVHRELIGDLIEKSIESCKNEKIELITFSIPDKSNDFKSEVANGLKILIETQNVDAVWIPNDPLLLETDIINEVWKPVLKEHKIPSVVCEKVLLLRGLGTLAVQPDITDLGKRVSEIMLTIKRNNWQADRMTIVDSVSIDKLINIYQARRYFGVKEENLKNYDEVTEETTIKDEEPPLDGTGRLSLRQLLLLAPSSGSFLDLTLSKSPLSMTIIDRDMIQVSGARHITELLETYVPGFQVMYNKWNGTSWGLRGITNDRNTKIIYLVNGHILNTQSRDGFTAELTLGMLDDIERVEVLRGPAGPIYGYGAIAGVVNVITRKPASNNEEFSCSYGNSDGNEIDSYIARVFPNNHRLALSFGWRKSDGLERHASILYGKHAWPYPESGISDKDLEKKGVPSDGSFGFTPNNYKIAGDWTRKNLRLYFRVTHLVESAGGWFIYDPWPDVYGGPAKGEAVHLVKNIDTANVSIGDPLVDNPNTFWVYRKNSAGIPDTIGWTTNLRTYYEKKSTIMGRHPDSKVNGETITPDDPFWSQVESGFDARRHYVSNNALAALNYDRTFDENRLKCKLEFVKAENRIEIEKRPGYDEQALNAIPSYVDVEETFGEQRLTASALYLFKSIPKLQLAGGYEFRWDGIGKDWSGKNEKHEQPGWKVVSDVDYFTNSVFTEGFYEVDKKIGFQFGGRGDFHTKANLFDFKVAPVYTPHKDHSIKILFQRSSQIGSADFYEYNRSHYAIDGKLREGWSFEKPYVSPDTTKTPVLIYVPTAAELKSLKPEQIYTAELMSTHFFYDAFTVVPSITLGMVKDQQKWVKEYFQVKNCPGYKFLNADLDVKYCNDKLTAGINHTYQRPIDDGNNKEITFTRPEYEYYDSAEGIYTPIMSETKSVEIPINMIKDAITYDGKNFLNLSTHLTKIYAAYKPFPWIALSANLRIYWGLQGRKQLYVEDEGFEYWNIDDKPMYKLNAGLHLNLSEKTEISFLGYNLLGIDKGLGYEGDENPLVRNTLRWQQMAENNLRGISSNDQMSLRILFKKAF